MNIRRLLVALIALAFLSVLFSGIRDSRDDGESASDAPSPETSPPTVTSAEPQPAFTDAALQAGLAAICSADAQGRPDEEPGQTYEQVIQTASERLAVSPAAEHLLAAALLAENESADQIDLIGRAVAAGPAEPLVLWSAVRICSRSRESPDCPLREWEQRLIAADGQNSESWMLVASNRYAAGDDEAALEAMRFASTAAESRIYWAETIEMIERALRVSDFSFPERASTAFGVAASELPYYRDVTAMCREHSPGNREWADVCLRYGELVEDQGKDVYSVSIARSVQSIALEALGESDRAAEVEERQRAGSREMADSGNRLHATAAELMMQEASVFFAYLAAVRLEGETGALRSVAAEIERLVTLHPELACE